MNAAILIALMFFLMPSRGAKDIAFRSELADAIVAATDDLQEQFLLASLPRWESSYRRDVAECRRKGPQGEVTAWQVLARNDAERARLCVSLEEDARMALERVRESLRSCSGLPAAERLAVYARGSCASVEGKRLSRVRWVDGGAR